MVLLAMSAFIIGITLTTVVNAFRYATLQRRCVEANANRCDCICHRHD